MGNLPLSAGGPCLEKRLRLSRGPSLCSARDATYSLHGDLNTSPPAWKRVRQARHTLTNG